MSKKLSIPDEVDKRIQSLQAEGYKWDKYTSIAAAGVVLRKGNDMYLFDMQYNEYHNPPALLTIQL